MKRLAFIFILIFIMTSFGVANAQLPPTEIDRISQSVVLIETYDRGRPIGIGSGTIISPDGIIYTNQHVLEDGDEFAIYLLDDPNELPVAAYFARPVQVFNQLDFAILQIDSDIRGNRIDPSTLNLPFISIAENEVIRGESIAVFGYPGIGDGFLVLTQGNITTVQNGTLGNVRLPVWYQTDAEISPGNSGGLAVNMAGEMVGIPTAVRTEDRTGGRLGGILPIQAINSLVANSTVRPNPPSTNSESAPPVDPDKAPSDIQPSSPTLAGWNVTCQDGVGANITDGVPITVVQMRPGFSYTATALGIDGYDPVLAVLDESGNGLCSDDNVDASRYAVDLPTTGAVSGAANSSQVTFSPPGDSLQDITLVVGGFGGASGEFVLVIEGMSVSEADGYGDPFQVSLTPQLLNSGIPLTTYMISYSPELDPWMGVVDITGNNYLVDELGERVSCDDAGSANLCWGNSSDLRSASVTLGDGTRIIGGSGDSMIALRPEAAVDIGYSNMTYLMSSYNYQSSGRYLMVFHMGLQN